jgi:chaperone modulatory protein CbpM
MANSHELVPVSEVVDPLTLIDLCRISGSSADWVIELVEEGILDPIGQGRTIWRFESTSITVVRKVQRLQSDLRLNIPGVAVVLSLADENAALKRQLQMLENDPHFSIRMAGPLE